MQIRSSLFLRLSGALLLSFVAGEALAQSTIFNIPTTDTVAQGKVYFEFDFLPQVPKPEGDDRLYIYNPRLVVGLGPNLEAGINVPSFHVSGATDVFAQPNIKWRFFSDDTDGLAAAGGGILFTPINHREGVETFGLVYGEFSKKVKTGECMGRASMLVPTALSMEAATGLDRRWERLLAMSNRSTRSSALWPTGSAVRMVLVISHPDCHLRYPRMGC
jgi:hypothetical protein